MSPTRISTAIITATLALSAPAFAQTAPDSLYTAAPSEQTATTSPTDGGRSTLLLALAALAVLSGGAIGVLAVRRPAPAAPVPRFEPEPEPAPPPREPWRPHVVSDLPPLPAFGSDKPPGV